MGVLKESVEVTMITKRILDLRVNLTISKLFVSTPVIEKQLTKAITIDKAIQFRTNSLDIDNYQAATISYT